MNGQAFRRAADGRYEIVDSDGEIAYVYERMGHALHHMETGHVTEPSCCSHVNDRGNVIVPRPVAVVRCEQAEMWSEVAE